MNRRIAWTLLTAALISGLLFASDKSSLSGESRASGASTLVIEKGYPVLTLIGSPEAMGQAQGKLLEGKTRSLFDMFMTPASRMVGGMKTLQAGAMKMEKHLLERHRKELKSLAAACDIEYPLLVTGCAFPDVYRGGGCSTLAVLGKAGKGGDPLLARNLDFFTLNVLDKNGIVVCCRPEGYNAFVSVTWPGLIGVLSGMNDKGLCCAVMEVRTGKRSNDGMPSIFLFRQVMEEAGSVGEALAILKKAKRVASNNLMLIDVSGAAAVAELGTDYFEVRKPKKGILFSTNHHIEAPCLQSSCKRFGRFEAFTKKHYGKLDVPLLQKALDAVNQGGITVQSMVFEPKARRLHLSMGTLPASRGSFKTLLFDEALRLKSADLEIEDR